MSYLSKDLMHEATADELRLTARRLANNARTQRQQAEQMAVPEPEQIAPPEAPAVDFGALTKSLTSYWTDEPAQQQPQAQRQQAGGGSGFDLNGLIGSLTATWRDPEPVPTPSGTPSAMPGQPRTVDATIQDGRTVPPTSGGDWRSMPVQPTNAGGENTAPPATGDIDNSSRQSFIRTAWPYMLQAANGDQNLAELMLAKAISENGSIGTGRPFWANNFCYDGATEVLTTDGWVQWPDASLMHVFATLNPSSGAIEYQRASHLTRAYYTGEMFRVASEGVDLLVTPEHRMWVRPSSDAPYQIIRARDLSDRSVEYLTLREVPGFRGRTRIRREPVAPLRNHVSEVGGLGSFKEMVGAHARRVIAVVADLLVGRQRHAVGRLVGPSVGKHVAPVTWPPETTVAFGVGVCRPHPTRSEFRPNDRPILVDLLPEAAGRIAPAGARAEAVVALLDEVRVGQEFSLTPFADTGHSGRLTGHRPSPVGGVTPRTSEPRGGAFRRKNYTASGSWESFDGMVYCATVPNGLLIVRRNGKIVVSGNSGIKGEGDAGSVEADTWEDYGNGPVNIRDRFAAYSTPQAGMAAFMDFLRNNSRYHGALARYQQSGDADALFDDILAAGYATDKQWANKVRSIRDTQVAPIVRQQQAADPRQSSMSPNAAAPSPVAASFPLAGASPVLSSGGAGSLPPAVVERWRRRVGAEMTPEDLEQLRMLGVVA